VLESRYIERREKNKKLEFHVGETVWFGDVDDQSSVGVAGRVPNVHERDFFTESKKILKKGEV
jgi:hypothetical protein